MYPFKDVIENEAQLVEIMGTAHPIVTAKAIDHLDEHSQAFIQRSPFIVLASGDDQGHLDVSPKGDPAGFIKILDNKTLVMPERLGNKRADSFKNVLKHPNVALIFLIPGKTETLRVSGTARIIQDSDILDTMKVNNIAPQLALAIHVDEVFFHCPKCMKRSKLWQPEHWPLSDDLPNLAQTMVSATKNAISVEDMEKGVEHDIKHRLY